jgi:hypothetical protein
MSKAIVATIAAVMLLAITASPADARQANQFKTSISEDTVYLAGAVCDFTYEQAFTADITVVDSPKGELDRVTTYVTHTNVDTGGQLTEVDQNTSLASSPTEVGIFWHLRDSSGKNVLVKAGYVTIDPATGDIVRYTPNSGFNQTFAQTICPALGGNPA